MLGSQVSPRSQVFQRAKCSSAIFSVKVGVSWDISQPSPYGPPGRFYKVFCTAFCNGLEGGMLEPVCCKKRQQKVPTKKLDWGIGDI